ncbi:hypothetical protein SAMN04487981_10232 [Streptomyces sp. cf386]|nr:hypothetical protein SAMN04487981_10232 [Streptomyces sp. cf386]
MAEQQEGGWEGRSTVTVADWVAAELEKAPDPSDEQRGVLSALFNSATPTEVAA